MLVGIIQGAAVVRPQNEEAHHFGIVFFQHFANGEEVAQALGHLLVVHTHEAVVHPIIHEATLMRTFTLRDLVLVMGELQVCTATVDVEMFTQ